MYDTFDNISQNITTKRQLRLHERTYPKKRRTISDFDFMANDAKLSCESRAKEFSKVFSVMNNTEKEFIRQIDMRLKPFGYSLFADNDVKKGSYYVYSDSLYSVFDDWDIMKGKRKNKRNSNKY